MKKLISAIMIFALLASLSLEAFALTPSYEFSEEYKAGIFYRQLIEYELTGDQRYDVLSIALTQLGYHEGDSDADMDGMNYSGGKNFVEYNRLYGKLDNGEGNGMSYGYAWCAAFVSWCMRQARVPESLVVKEVSCPRTIKFLESKGTYHTRESGFVPSVADMIFFKNASSTATSTHIGLVIGVKDGEVITIEGNANGCVSKHSYKLTDTYIVGYGAPEYTVKEGTKYDFSLDVTDENDLGEYIITADSLNVRSGPGTSNGIVGTVKNGDRVNVVAIDGGWGKIEKDGLTGWISLSYAVSTSKMCYTVSFSAGDGKNAPVNQRKIPGAEIVISDKTPTQTGFSFVGWTVKAGSKTVDYRPGDKYTDDADIKLYAVWEPLKIKVTLLDDDGKTVLSVVEYDYGTDLKTNPPETPSKPDSDGYRYVFAGWSQDLTRYLKGETSYTAQWTAEKLPETEAETTGAAENETSKKGCGSASMLILPAVSVILCAAVIKRKRY
ncbi:MAG: SH3 domain-containing protein [Clostridia bacterium]|nr:SH3 domain-containing protein [Clostridia bacterium]